jgi:hypothetical protein
LQRNEGGGEQDDLAKHLECAFLSETGV